MCHVGMILAVTYIADKYTADLCFVPRRKVRDAMKQRHLVALSVLGVFVLASLFSSGRAHAQAVLNETTTGGEWDWPAGTPLFFVPGHIFVLESDEITPSDEVVFTTLPSGINIATLKSDARFRQFTYRYGIA